MKLSDFYTLQALHEKRNQLKLQIDIVGDSDGGGVGVTIVSTYQDAEMIAAVRPHILAELKRRIAENTQALKDMGVEAE